MNSKLFAAITVVLIASIVLTSIGFVAAAPKNHETQKGPQKTYDSFTLTATGTAKNAVNEAVAVSISIEGNANGKLKTVFHLHTQSGDATIQGYDAISAVRGQGIVVNKNNYIHLVIMMSSDNYGGRATLWVLRGTTDDLTSNTMPVSLHAPRVVLPLEGHPRLTQLTLDGTITFQ